MAKGLHIGSGKSKEVSSMFSLLRTNFSRLLPQTGAGFLKAPLGNSSPFLTRGFKVRTAIKKFCSDCYVCLT